MVKRVSKRNTRGSKGKVGNAHRPQVKQRRLRNLTQSPGLNWEDRYGDLEKYKKQCAIAHQSVKGLCCVCLTKPSEQLHHAKYGSDRIGLTVFPVCLDCHEQVCHSSKNWNKDKHDPVWGNQNTPEFIERLQLGYELLYGGIE